MRQAIRNAALGRLPARLVRHAVGWKNRWMGEPEIRRLPAIVPRGKVALDVGARWGAYAYFLSRLCPHVHAFEPDPAAADFLRRCGYANVTIHEIALSDAAGTAELVVPMGAGGEVAGRSNLRRTDAAVSRVHRVATARLDDLGLDAVGFIKIDVEGHEERVISGATAMIQRDRPVLLVEIEARHGSSGVADTVGRICALGYMASFLHEDNWVSFSAFNPDAHQRADHADRPNALYINNFLFRPE